MTASTVENVRSEGRWTSAGQLPPGNWFAPPGSNASSRCSSESFEMHVHASCADNPKGIVWFRQLRPQAYNAWYPNSFPAMLRGEVPIVLA